ncbi:hypothetical protein GMMP15_540018 [Candidatus Magnetomoraceae bacterium gMMP-15]
MLSIGVITVSNVNFRARPDFEADIIKVFPHATQIEILEDQGEWLKVRRNEKEGFIVSHFIHQVPDDTDVIKIGSVNVPTKLNLRSEPNGQIIDSLSHGSNLLILEDHKDWLKIKSDNKKGFVSANYIDHISEQPVKRGATSPHVSEQPVENMEVSSNVSEVSEQPVVQPQTSPSIQKGTINVPNGLSLNLYLIPDGNVKFLQTGTIVEIVGENQDGWLKIKSDEEEGLAVAEYIQ